MSLPDENSPYRQDFRGAYDRIAALESELNSLRSGMNSQQSQALAELRIAHLQEDRADVITRYLRQRNVLFGGTAGGMLASFAWFLYQASRTTGHVQPIWIACAMAVCAVASVGWIAQALVRRGTAAKVRKYDRRLSEERVLSGISAKSSLDHNVDSRVRVTVDPLASLDSETHDTGLLGEPAERAKAR